MADPAAPTVSFIEIGSSDAGATQAFFGSVFGWPCHDGAWLQTPTIKAGTHGDDPAPQIYVYFNVSDSAAAGSGSGLRWRWPSRSRTSPGLAAS